MYSESIFTNVNKYVDNGKGKVSYTGILIASKLNQKNGQDYKLLDAIDIDWNGAWIESMPGTYLYTTEDLIDVLNRLNKANEVGKIQDEIDKIWQQINEITASYVTYSYLEDHLSTYWQRQLVFGEYIGIDPETYTVYAYNLPTYLYLERNYTTQENFEAFQNYIDINYYNKTETNKVAHDAAYDAMLQVIAGADEKFDTLKEVADWILEQSVWVKVDLNEILEALKLPEWPKDTYFTFDEESGEYIPVNNPEEIDTSGKTIYWKKENYLVELKKLIVRVNSLDDRVGDKYYHEEGDFYTYTGLFQDIADLKSTDETLQQEIDYLFDEVDYAKQTANEAYNIAYTAYETSYVAYEIAYTALEQSFESTHKANLAYDMAYTAIIKVGEETQEYGIYPVEYDKLAEYIAEGKQIIYYNEFNDIVFAEEPFDPEKQYHYIQPYVEGTGLTRRVELVEEKADRALTTAEIALDSSYESLYHLFVNNSESSYVKLGLQPTEYNGNRDRVLSITTSEATIDRHTGEIFGEGLININTAFNIYSYASSWMMLYVDEDIEFPNQDSTSPPIDPENPDEPDIF